MIKASLHLQTTYKHKGKLFLIDNAPPPKPLVLVLRGNASERGEQLAHLLHPYLKKLILGWTTSMKVKTRRYYKRFFESDYLINIWQNLRPSIDHEQLVEIESAYRYLQKKSYIHNDLNIFIKCHLVSVLADLANKKKFFIPIKEDNESLFKCCAFAVWGKRTKNEHFIFGKTLDVNLKLTHKQTPLCILRFPQDGYNSFVVSWILTPFICFAGFNDAGLCYGEVGAPNAEESLNGNIWSQFMTEILQNCNSLDAALDKFENYRSTHGINFVLGDTKNGGSGISIECTSKRTRFITRKEEAEAVYNSPGREMIKYGRPLENAIYHTDIAFNSKIRAGQVSRSAHGPKGFWEDKNPLTATDYKNIYYPCYASIEDLGGEFTELNGIELIRTIATKHENVLNILFNMTEQNIFLSYFQMLSNHVKFGYSREFVKLSYQDILMAI